MSNPKRNLTIAALMAMAGAAVVLLLVSSTEKSTILLPDGSRLALSRAKFGVTNEFAHGSFLSKLLGDLIPQKGIRLGSYRLNRPFKHDMSFGTNAWLTIELRLLPGQDQASTPALLSRLGRTGRLTISGDDGFPLGVHTFPAFNGYPASDGMVAYPSSITFPRGSKRLYVALDERKEPGQPWIRLGRLSYRNPGRREERHWKEEASPIHRHTNDLAIVIGEITATDQPPLTNGFWQATTIIPVQVRRAGVLETNWVLHSLEGEDASGNRKGLSSRKQVADGWIIHRWYQSLDPSEVWRVRGELTRDRDFVPKSTLSVQVPLPLTGVLHTNLGGYPFNVELDKSMVDTTFLAVELATNLPNTRVNLLAIQDAQGNPVGEGYAVWSRLRVGRQVSDTNSGPLLATIALHENYPLEFTVKPRLLREGETVTRE